MIVEKARAEENTISISARTFVEKHLFKEVEPDLLAS